MIKYLKKLWKKYFRSLGDSRTKKEVEVVKLIPTPKPTHCGTHKRFKKSCPNCQEVIK
jgi:hypothetical protein